MIADRFEIQPFQREILREFFPPQLNPDCWLAQHGFMERDEPMPPCDGQLVRVHLVSQQFLRREGLDHLCKDARTWVPGCGGITGGPGGHHGHFDSSKRLRVAFDSLPGDLLILAEEYGFTWWLGRTYA